MTTATFGAIPPWPVPGPPRPLQHQTADPAAALPKRSRSRARIVGGALLTALLATEVVLALPYAEGALPILRHAQPGWLTLALLAQVLSMAAFARMQARMLAAGGTRVGQGQMLAMTLAANAVSASLPVGAVLSTGYAFRRMRAWGASAPTASFTLLASGALSTATFAGLAVTAAGTVGTSNHSIILSAVPAMIGFGATLAGRRGVRNPDRIVRWLDRPVRAAYRLARRDPDHGHLILAHVAQGIMGIKLRRRDWAAGLTYASLNWVADLACLAAACRAVGLDAIGTGWIAVAYLAAMGVSSLPLLPGGIGTVDAAMVVVLVSGGAHAPLATAAVVVYRMISFVFVVIFGWTLWAAIGWADAGSLTAAGTRTGGAGGASCCATSSSDRSSKPRSGPPHPDPPVGVSS